MAVEADEVKIRGTDFTDFNFDRVSLTSDGAFNAVDHLLPKSQGFAVALAFFHPPLLRLTTIKESNWEHLRTLRKFPTRRVVISFYSSADARCAWRKASSISLQVSYSSVALQILERCRLRLALNWVRDWSFNRQSGQHPFLIFQYVSLVLP